MSLPITSLCILSIIAGAAADIGSFYQYEGISYNTSSKITGTTDFNGTFTYNVGDSITFSTGSLVLGTTQAKTLLTPANLVAGVDGNDSLINSNNIVSNMATFLLSLDNDTNTENGVFISQALAATVSAETINFDQDFDAFNSSTSAFFSRLNKTLTSAAAGRNYLRSSMLGIKRFRDVQIPIQNNTTPYVLGDIYRPIGEGVYPAIINLGGYGKAMPYGCLCTQADRDAQDVYEDSYFTKEPTFFFDPVIHKNFTTVIRVPEFKETIGTHAWVPRGYIKILVDGPGICNTPGTFRQFSLEEGQAFKYAIEWAVEQPWSNGKVGIWGVSYWANMGIIVASLKPKGLTAMILHMADFKSYFDYVFNAGLFSSFQDSSVTQCLPEGQQGFVNFAPLAKNLTFYSDEVYGPEGNLTISPNIDNVDIPLWVTSPLEHPGLHTRGSSELFINGKMSYKRFALTEGDIFGYPYDPLTQDSQMAYFDYYLKDLKEENTKIFDEATAQIKIRTGDKQFQWANYTDWPPAETVYKKFYLSADPSTTLPNINGKIMHQLLLSPDNSSIAANLTYSAADTSTPTDSNRLGYIAADCSISGVAFVTNPLPANISLAGYMKLVVYVSSSSDSDMDLHVSVNGLTNNGTQRSYILYDSFGDIPPGYGWLKVSHRKLNEGQSTIYRPVHTHLEKDYAPLVKDEIVEVVVELWPATSHLREGDRLKLDVQPLDMCGAPSSHTPNKTYHTNSSLNTLWMGGEYQSYLQVPTVPVAGLSVVDAKTANSASTTNETASGSPEVFKGGANSLMEKLTYHTAFGWVVGLIVLGLAMAAI